MLPDRVIFCFILLTIATSPLFAQEESSTYDDTGLSPNYKPSVKLDPRLRKALLRVLTKLDQEEGGKGNEVSIRDINNQVTTTAQYDQPFQYQRADDPTGPSINGFRPIEGTSTHTPVSINQDYSRLTQQPYISAASSTAASAVATADYESLYQQFKNLQNKENGASTVSPTQVFPSNSNESNTSSNFQVLSPQDLEAFYKQQAANNPQPQGTNNLIPEFVDFNQNFISNPEDIGVDNEKLSKALGYKIIKFDKNDKESINNFLQNNNIEIISTLNTGGNNNPTQVGQNEVLLSNFNQQKASILSSLKVNNEIKNDSSGLLNPKENEIVKQKPKDVLPTPNEPLISNEDLYKTIVLSSKGQADSEGNAIFYNPNNIIGPSGKEGELETKPTDIPTFTGDATESSDNSTAGNKTSEVQFFSVPLVAAFTLQQNSLGIPQKVIPLNYLANGEYISEDRVKSIEEAILLNKQRQKVSEAKNNTKELDELKAKQIYLEQEKIYVDEKLKEFKQNESREKLIQQQTIGLQTANLEQYLQKYSREPKQNSEFSSLQFGNQNLELKKQQLQDQFAREAALEKYKKLEFEKQQEQTRQEKLKQFEKNLRDFTQTESSLAQYKTSGARPQEIAPQSAPFKPSFPLVNFDNLPPVNFDNLPPVDFQKSLNLQYSSQFLGQPNFPTNQPIIPPSQQAFTPVIRSQQPVFSDNAPTFPAQQAFQNNVQPNFIPNVPRVQKPNFEPNFNQLQQPNFEPNFNQPQQPNFQPNFNQPQQLNFIPNQNIVKQPQVNNIQFNPNPFQNIPRQNFQPNFQPNNHFITGAQFPQQNFQQGRSFPIENFRPSQPLSFPFQNGPLPFQNNFQQPFNQPFVQQPFLSNNRIVRKEPFHTVGNFGVNNFVLPPTKTNTFKRNIVPPSRVLEPPFV